MADAVAVDVGSALLTDPDRALVRFAQALTSHASVVPDREIDAMRPFFDDAAVLRATEVVAYFNFVNRLATGLAVELEEEESP